MAVEESSFVGFEEAVLHWVSKCEKAWWFAVSCNECSSFLGEIYCLSWLVVNLVVVCSLKV